MKKTLKKVLVATMISSLIVQVALAAVQKQWPSQGTPGDIVVSNNPPDETEQYVVQASDGDYIVTYLLNGRAYTQKFSATDGSAVAGWNGGFPGIAGIGTPRGIISDGAGGAYVAWNNDLGGGDCDVFIQRIDSTGSIQYGFGGTNVTTGSGCEAFMQMIPDGSGGVYILWGNGGPNTSTFQSTDLYVSRMDSAGTVNASWNTGGAGTWRPLQLPESQGGGTNEHSGHMVADGTGSIVAVYESSTPSFYFAATKFDANGNLAGAPWNTPLQIDANANGNLGRNLRADGSGNVYIGFQAGPFGSPSSVEAQKINSAGALQWGTGVTVSSTDIDSYSGQPRIVDDGSGGVIMAWQTSGANSDIYAHHVTSGGTLDATNNWASAPIALSDTTQDTSWFQTLDRDTALSDGAGGAYVLYGSYEGGSWAVTKLQHIESDGSVEFAGDGTTMGVGAGIEGVQSKMTSDGANGVVVVYQDETPSGQDLYAQFFDDVNNPCAVLGSQDFCGTQIIAASTLTFQDIPDSFNFGTITEGSSQDLFNNENLPGPNAPGVDDLLQILDDRNSGGFTLTVDPEGTFIEETATYTIPLANLYTITSLDETDPGNVGGVTYGAGFTGDQTVSAPLYVDVDSVSLTNTASYTGLAPGSQFGGSPLVLMNGTLPSASGRNGTMSVFTNFYLKIDPNQQEGSYALKLTYTLADSTT